MPFKEHVLRIITTKLKVDKLIVNLSCVKRNPMFVFRIIFRFRGFICWQGLFLLKVKCTFPSKSFLDVLKEIFVTLNKLQRIYEQLMKLKHKIIKIDLKMVIPFA